MCTSERMKNRRLELGLSVDDIAKKVGVSRSTYFRYESGEIEKVSVQLLKPIAEALRTSPSYLAGWEDEPENSTSIRIAAHIDDGVSEEEMDDIIHYIEFLKSQHKG